MTRPLITCSTGCSRLTWPHSLSSVLVLGQHCGLWFTSGWSMLTKTPPATPMQLPHACMSMLTPITHAHAYFMHSHLDILHNTGMHVHMYPFTHEHDVHLHVLLHTHKRFICAHKSIHTHKLHIKLCICMHSELNTLK